MERTCRCVICLSVCICIYMDDPAFDNGSLVYTDVGTKESSGKFEVTVDGELIHSKKTKGQGAREEGREQERMRG